MGGTATGKKVAIPSGKGSNPVAEAAAKEFGLLKTSGLRTQDDLKNKVGFAGDDHQKGIAADFAPPKNIANTPQGRKMMDDFADWAVKSGQYSKVIYKGKNLITGKPVDGHYDHVHVSWE